MTPGDGPVMVATVTYEFVPAMGSHQQPSSMSVPGPPRLDPTGAVITSIFRLFARRRVVPLATVLPAPMYRRAVAASEPSMGRPAMSKLLRRKYVASSRRMGPPCAKVGRGVSLKVQGV